MRQSDFSSFRNKTGTKVALKGVNNNNDNNKTGFLWSLFLPAMYNLHFLFLKSLTQILKSQKKGESNDLIAVFF